MLVIQIVCLITFYSVVFGPQEIGWNAAASRLDGSSAIAFGVIVLFDNWLWPDPGEPILIGFLSERASRALVRSFSRLPIFSRWRKHTSTAHCQHRLPTLPGHMALLDQAMAEGASEYRRAILLAAITRTARVSLEVDRLVTTARENLPREIRTMVPGEIQRAVNAIAAALDEITHKLPAHITAGAEELAAPRYADPSAPGDGHSGRARDRDQTNAYIGNQPVPRKSEISRNSSDSLAVLEARHYRAPAGLSLRSHRPRIRRTVLSLETSAVPSIERYRRSRGGALLLESRLVHRGRTIQSASLPSVRTYSLSW